MPFHKLKTTDAFIAFDLADAPATGVSRVARKVLVDGAFLLARSTTYSFAAFGIRMGGGSAGINAEGDDRDDAVAAFVEEVTPLVAEGRWTTDPNLGLDEADVAPLRAVDARPATLWSEGLSDELTARGAVAAAGAARAGGLGGATIAVVGKGSVAEAARNAVTQAGASPAGDALDADVDIVLVAGKSGVVDHEAAETVTAGVVVPLTPLALTARAHAVLSSAGRVHVPDFLALAAPLLLAHAEGIDDADAAVTAVAEKVAQHTAAGTGLWLAAVEEAEAFLASWQDELPFGRPLA